MKMITKNRKKAKEFLQEMEGKTNLLESYEALRQSGKKALDECMLRMGQMLAESIMLLEREEISGSDYHPREGYQKWGWQRGSIYLGDQKVRLEYPRLRDNKGEVSLKSYERMHSSQEFSEELLQEALRGLSGRKYRETVIGVGKRFGVSPTSISNRFIEASAKKLEELRERDLSGYEAFALFIDTVHRGGVAFIVALGIDRNGQKQVLGFWEGASENKEICQCLLSDMESRGLRLTSAILFITDGGKGIQHALKDLHGASLMHQRCCIHKDRNIQRHFALRGFVKRLTDVL